MTSERKVVVVGGGIIGIACAHYLTECGDQVTVLDRSEIGKGCSHANCGLICPSHVLPLAEPGSLRQALRAMFADKAPFAIKPRWDPALWSWLWNFALRCNYDDMLHAGRSIQALLDSSRQLYEQLIADQRLACEWETRGLLYVYRSRDAMQSYAHVDQLLREAFGVPAKRFDGDAVCQLEPALQPGLAGGWLYEHDAHLRPDKLIATWRQRLEERGARFLERCEFQGFARAGGRATAARTTDGELPGDDFVVALGAWTPFVASELGCPLPIEPGKGYSLTMPRPRVCPQIPLIFPETRVAVTPMQSGYRLGSTMEFAGYDTTIDAARLKLLTEGARPYLQQPSCEPVLEQWYGWRPMTYDSRPIIGRSPRMENVMIAAGHNMLGLSMAPGTGRLVAELLHGQRPHLNPDPYSWQRF